MLEQAVGHEYKILTRVKLTDIIEPKGSATSKNRRAALLKANSKTVDFVLCDKQTMTAVGVVNLVNNLSKDGHRAKQDWFVNGALEAAGLPHIRIKIKTGYKTDEIRNCILYKLGKIRAPQPAPARKPLVKGTMGTGLRSPSTALAQA